MRLLAISIFTIALFGCSHAPDMAGRWEAVDAKARQLMDRQAVEGLALAIIADGEIVHVQSFGFRNVEKGHLLETDTIMYGASLTKTAFAYMVLQLVDEGVFDLDTPLADYLPAPIPEYEFYTDLAGDERWKALTARHVLTHSTGFHNFRWLEDDRILRFHFHPGERYAYSGEGFYLLQFALEEGLKLNVKEEMQRRVFDRFDMPNTSMQWRPDFAQNLADGYALDGSFEPHDERSNVSAAGSMDTTISDQAKMWAGIVNGNGVSAASRAELVRPQRAIKTASQFPPLWITSDARAGEIELSAGLGLVTYQGDAGLAWFKGGHNDWTGNIVACQDVRRDCVILLSNRVKSELIYPELVNFILKDPKTPFWWEYSHVE